MLLKLKSRKLNNIANKVASYWTEAFSKTTDGPNCPISHVYKPEEFISLAERGGFSVNFLGAAISVIECALFYNKRFEAIENRKLSRESREFYWT